MKTEDNNMKSISESGHSEHRMFPMFVDITDKNVIVIGGGAIAARRIKTLLQFGCKICVISDSLHSDLDEIKSSFEWTNRKYKINDVAGADIVIAATNNREVNATVVEECKEKGIVVNVVDCKEECSFYFPAIVIDDDIVAGISSSGKDPALTKKAAGVVRAALEKEESL